MTITRNEKADGSQSSKKPYNRPTVRHFGDFRVLTLGGGGAKNEGGGPGSPNTKA